MRIQFQISAYEYNCENTACSTTTIAESYDHFIQPYSRMTNRLSEFLFTLALETSCEGAARIAKTMNIKISGDTIIKLLIKKYDSTNVSSCSDVIGVDDFAFKKGSNYGTIIVDDESRRTIDLLEGRDSKALSTLLKQNQHIKVVTRDRASAYAKVLNRRFQGLCKLQIDFIFIRIYCMQSKSTFTRNRVFY